MKTSNAKLTSLSLRKMAVSLFSLAMVLWGCGSNDGDLSSNESVGEIATAAIGNSVNSATPGGVALYEAIKQESLWASATKRLFGIPDAYAASVCPTPDNSGANGAASGACSVSANVMTLTYPQGCSFLKPDGTFYAPTWSGGPLVLTVSPSSFSPTCGSTGIWTAGNAVTKTFTQPLVRTITNARGASQQMSEDSASSGFETPVSGGITITIVDATHRTLSLSGLHLASTVFGRKRSAKVWDHSLTTVTAVQNAPAAAANLDITVSNAGTSLETRTITDGTILTQHNLAKFVASTTFTSVVYGPIYICKSNSTGHDLGTGSSTCTNAGQDNGCAASGGTCTPVQCPHPIAGQVESRYTNPSTQSSVDETITFDGQANNTCGHGKFRSGNVLSELQLSHSL